MINEKQLQTYVFCKDGSAFFVSTILRDSSAIISPPPRYFETIIWEWLGKKRERGELLSDHGSTTAAKHYELCRILHIGGLEGLRAYENEQQSSA